MFVINEDKSIYVTRGDTAIFSVEAEVNGDKHVFKNGDVVRIKVFEKKACENVVLQKEFLVEADTESVVIILDGHDTKIGEVISKPTDYWYEVELNPFTNPQTIIGYDDDGAKVFKLFPEGKDVPSIEYEDDIPLVDDKLDLTSDRPIQNQAISRALCNAIEMIRGEYSTADSDLRTEIENQLKDCLKGESLTGYVKDTDYATKTKAGVVKVGADSMGVKLNADNTLVIAGAGVSEIQAMASANRPITPYYLKQAVKTGFVNNDLEWTEEEKGRARAVIGIESTGEIPVYPVIVDNLESTDKNAPLSANMGRDVNSRIPSGGVRFEHLNTTAPSEYLTSLGITVDNTLTEIFAKLPVKSITYINVNAQNTTFAQCLPVQNGGVLTIKKGEDGRGQLQFDALDTGLSYSTYCKDFVVSLDWVSNDWEENSVASGWGSGFSTLASFWEYVERYMYKSASTSCMIKAKINSGCFSNGFTGWCRAWCSTQNAINSDYDVTGSIILVDGSDNVYYGRINGGKGDPSTLTDTWQQFITSLDVANNYTTTAAGYVADARTVKNLYDFTVEISRYIRKRDWAATHTITLKAGYFYLFVGLDCMYSAYVYSDGSVNVQQIFKASGSKVTYTTGNKTLTFKTSDGGTCAFMVITNAPA